jgi:hypothetical protein
MAHNINSNANQNTVQIDNINIKRGIFQGDELSPLWFTLALNPLSTLLNSTQYGFKMKRICYIWMISNCMQVMKATKTLNQHYEQV